MISDDTYMLQLVRYIHQNPREILEQHLELSDYEWSSYPNYLGLRKEDFLNTDFVLNYFSKKDPTADFKKFCEAGFTEKELRQIRSLMLETLETGT